MTGHKNSFGLKRTLCRLSSERLNSGTSKLTVTVRKSDMASIVTVMRSPISSLPCTRISLPLKFKLRSLSVYEKRGSPVILLLEYVI